MKILNFGSCNIDYVYSLDHIVVPGETISSHNLSIFPGGKGLNQSIAAAKAGACVYHAGGIGEDGLFLRDMLNESGVNTENLKITDEKSGHAIIQVSRGGENSILLYGGANEAITKEFADEVLSKFDKDDIILLQNEISNLSYIIKQAYAKGMTIVFNPAPFDEGLKNIDFNMISYLILNEIEGGGFSGKENPEDIIAFMQRNYPDTKIVLTIGKKGCIYADKEQLLQQRAFKVEAVDTTAAGDTFTGYFLASIVEGKTPSEAIRLACAASALAVSKEGAAPSIPSRDEVELALKNLQLKMPEKSSKSDEQRKKIEEYISENISGANLEDLSKILGYSTVYAGEIVKKLTGKSFSKLLQEKRCGFSRELLIKTDLPIDEIIHRAGYENESFFRRIFKEIYGKSPCKYRKAMRGIKE